MRACVPPARCGAQSCKPIADDGLYHADEIDAYSRRVDARADALRAECFEPWAKRAAQLRAEADQLKQMQDLEKEYHVLLEGARASMRNHR